MTGFGDSLRTERERRGLSLAEVCARTKVSERNLQAIEHEHFGELPPGVFRRGMVKAYLLALGLDPAIWMPRFAESAERVLGPEPDLSADGLAVFAENVQRARVPSRQRNSLRWLAVLVLLVLLGAAAYAVWRFVLHGRLR